MADMDPTFEYIDAPKRVDFAQLTKEEANIDKWFDESRTEDEEFNKVIRLQDIATNDDFFKMAPAMEDSDDANLASSENEHEDPNHKIFAASLRSESSTLPLSATRGFTVKTWEPKLTVPRSPNFATSSRIRSKIVEEADQPKPQRRHNFKIGDLTVPETPQFATEHRLKRKILQTTEEMQMRQIQDELENENKRRKFQDKMRVKALVAQSYVPERSVRALTQPKEFHFRTDDRLRHHHDHDEDHEHEEHGHTERGVKYHGGLTVPHPFQFHTDGRLKSQETLESEQQPFVSAVEKANNFLKRADRRPYMTKRQGNKQGELPYDPVNWKPALTVPHEFSFETASRISSKPKETYKSQAEREEEEMRNFQPFRAKPVDRKVLDGTASSFRVEKLAVTRPEPFHFVTDSRIKEPKIEEISFSSSRHGSTIKSSSFLRDSTMKRSEPFNRELTVPASPALSTKQRAQTKATHSKPEEESTFQFKARPVPASAPFVPKHVEMPLTEPTPFPLKTESRGTVAQQRFREQLEREREEEERQRQFRARAMPDMDEPLEAVIESSLKPQASFRELTHPEPFQLKAEERGQVYQQNWKVKVDDEFRREAEQRQFKARKFAPKPVFEPAKSTRPLTEISDFNLNSDYRAAKRQEWENDQAAKQRAADEMRKQYELELQEKQRKELEDYRKSLVFRAQPVTHGKPISLRPSNLPLTEPQSPMLRTKRRVGMRDL